MKKVAAAIVVSLIASVSAARADPSTPANGSNGDQYVFSMSAASGTYSADTLTLKTVPLVVYFTERPQRTSGHMDLQAFLDLWGKGVDNFKQDPPNAELSIFRSGGDAHSILIISSPTVEGENISFKVVLLDENIPEDFNNSTLFIDALGVIFPSDQN